MGGEIFIIGCVLFVTHPSIGFVFLVGLVILKVADPPAKKENITARDIYNKYK